MKQFDTPSYRITIEADYVDVFGMKQYFKQNFNLLVLHLIHP